MSIEPRSHVYFHRASNPTPGWIWQALFAAHKDAGRADVPMVIAGPQDRGYVMIDVDAFNCLVADKEVPQ
ncbi:MAG: hypothetical protein ACR2OU_17225 [Thermomicrobiales bacterium]